MKQEYKVKIIIEGEPGTGKSIILNELYKFLKEAGYPVGIYSEEPHVIYTSLKD